jgi:hypothetical protein
MDIKAFTVIYKDEKIEFTPLYTDGFLSGYAYIHPPRPGFVCKLNWVDTESGSRHKLKFNDKDEATIEGSLACPQGCGWHVIIKDGIAND